MPARYVMLYEFMNHARIAATAGCTQLGSLTRRSKSNLICPKHPKTKERKTQISSNVDMDSELTSKRGRDIQVWRSRLHVAATTQAYTAYKHAGR